MVDPDKIKTSGKLSNQQIITAWEDIRYLGGDWFWVILALQKHFTDPEEVLKELEVGGWVSIDDDSKVTWIEEIPKHKELYILHLERQLRHKKRLLTDAQETISRLVKRLDALWWVWCDGSCQGGVARYSGAKLTQETINVIEKNLERLKRKFKNLQRNGN